MPTLASSRSDRLQQWVKLNLNVVVAIIVVLVLFALVVGFIAIRIKRKKKKHIDGLNVVKYEQLVNTDGYKNLGTDDVETARSTAKPKAEEKAESTTKQDGWLLCCSRRQQNAVQTGRLARKPAEQKLQRSAGASRSEPRVIDWSHADPEKWSFKETLYSGSSMHTTKPVIEVVAGTIAKGLEDAKAKPTEYEGIYYQTDMTSWPEDQQKYTLLKRNGSGFSVKEAKGGAFTYVCAKYAVLPADVKIEKDKYTDSCLASSGKKKLGAPLHPGRGSGCGDLPGLKIIGDADPSDVAQGAVGDCWLLSAISAMAEYDAAIDQLFKKTPNVKQLPGGVSNTYTITLYDVPTGKPVDIVIDERLSGDENGELLASKPSVDGELWVCYLEKAVAAHCGGWDKIDGGTCTHGWRLLTGCMDQFTIRDDGEGFCCYGAKNPNTKTWETLGNAPSEGFQGLWPMDWPEAGGGGGMHEKLEANDVFERMCAWHDRNYLMGCGSKAGHDAQDTDGIVDGHAYTILDCIDDAGGKRTDNLQFDMIKVRNPWGKGEFKSGKFDDDGPGWEQYPEVKKACQPVQADDGVFWLEKDEFFKYFHTIYLCAYDMSKFVGTAE